MKICFSSSMQIIDKQRSWLISLFSVVVGNRSVRGAGVYIIHQGEKKHKETQIINAALWKKKKTQNMKFNVFSSN